MEKVLLLESISCSFSISETKDNRMTMEDKAGKFYNIFIIYFLYPFIITLVLSWLAHCSSLLLCFPSIYRMSGFFYCNPVLPAFPFPFYYSLLIIFYFCSLYVTSLCFSSTVFALSLFLFHFLTRLIMSFSDCSVKTLRRR